MIYTYLLLVLFFIATRLIEKQNKNFPKKIKNDNPNFCILIPARDESLVIEGLLKSIKNQSIKVPMENVYVIVEDEKDKTVAITKKYNANIFVRKRLDLKRKGYALDECIKEIYPKNYDAYFIFDADNILDKDFIKEMMPFYKEGYDLVTGYRNIKNKDNVIATSSHLTFSILNGLVNEAKNKDTRNVTLSGTGFFINGKWIKKWKGYPFHELTEDYELTLYSIEKNMTSFYNKKAIFYDEQPTNLKTSIIQRKRWIKGYFASRKKYISKLRKTLSWNGFNNGSRYTEILGIIPIIFILILFIIPLIKDIAFLITTKTLIEAFKIITSRILILYLIAVALSYILIQKENSKLKLDTLLKLKTAFYHPLYLLTYIHAFFLSLLEKEVTWEKIEHKETLSK